MSFPVPTDPAYADQWHLFALGDLLSVWANYRGGSVHLGIFDGGVNYNHADLAPNYDPSRHVIIDGQVLDGNQTGREERQGHGTLVAGVVGAAINGLAGVGIAPEVKMTGVNVFDPASPIYYSGAATREDYQAAMSQMASFDVAYTVLRDSSSGHVIWPSFQYATEIGRDGLGTVIVQPAGNLGTDMNTAASRFTISVPGLYEDGSVYRTSSHGASALVSGPGEGAAIVASGPGRLGSGDATWRDDFGWTSASSAMITGVATLILDANAGLGWRDVSDILAMSARHTGSPIGGPSQGYEDDVWIFNGAEGWNGGGMHYSRDYGFGLPDALAAVRLAEAYAIMDVTPHSSGNELLATTGVIRPVLAIPDTGTVTYSFTLADNLLIDQVELSFMASHASRKELEIALTSPSGTTAILMETVTTAPSLYIDGLIRTMAETFRGELSAGTWTVTVTDNVAGNAGTLTDLKLDVYGDPAPGADDIYTFTDEFAAMVALDPSRGVLADIDGGIDWINAAAITGNAIFRFDLHSQASSLNGVPLQIAPGTTIENVITGDGNDTVHGNGEHNRLHGGRGNDGLAGGDGNDSLYGGAGDDRLFGGAGDDRLVGGTGRDALTGNAGVDYFVFQTAADSPVGSGRDVITDFEVGIDKIVFLDDATTFIGSIGFRGEAGSVRAVMNSVNTVVEVDVDGDRIADMQIQLNGRKVLSAGDFLFGDA
jgi:subtilisin-like proprotein convertase family protein